MIIAKCNLDQLAALETILFAAEWSYNPCIPPFGIQCENETYYYKVEKNLNKYYIITI